MPLVDVVENHRQLALLCLSCEDLVGLGQRVQRCLVGEDSVVGHGFRDGIVVVGHALMRLFGAGQRNYVCDY